MKVTNLCPHMIATKMTAGRKFMPEQMIETNDICSTLDYLLNLSKNAIPFEIVIHCMPFVRKDTSATYEIYGLDK